MEQRTIRFQLRGVKKYYHKRLGLRKRVTVGALEDVHLKIYEGKINALVGKSGSGKSTLARILMGLEDFDAGEISYKGRSLTQVPVRAFRRRNRIMFQNPYLSVNPYFKIRKIIAEPLRIERVPRPEIEKRLAALLEILGIDPTLLIRYPHQLSGGQLQRVVLARALIGEPEFLILDEPFSSLDEIMAGRLMEHFKGVFRRLKVGVLFISHHLERVRFLADYVSVIDKGRITVHTPKQEFFSAIPEQNHIYFG